MQDENVVYSTDETTTQEWSPDVGDLMIALAKAQAEMSNPDTDKPNNFGTHYASLAAVRNAVVPVLAKHGIATTQLPTPFREGYAGCVTILWHGSQYLKSTIMCKVIRFVSGGAITLPANLSHTDYTAVFSYLRRTGLKALVCVADETDEDEERHLNKDGQREARDDRRQRPAPPIPDMIEQTPAMRAEGRRLDLLDEVATLYKQHIMPLKHAGMHKAIFLSCFALDKPEKIKEQSLETFERGMPLYRRLTAALPTWHRNVTPSPDAWIREQERLFAAEDAAVTVSSSTESVPPHEEDGVLIEDAPLDDMPPEFVTRQEAAAQRAREEAELLDKTTA
jgi:ERF superfamily protein